MTGDANLRRGASRSWWVFLMTANLESRGHCSYQVSNHKKNSKSCDYRRCVDSRGLVVVRAAERTGASCVHKGHRPLDLGRRHGSQRLTMALVQMGWPLRMWAVAKITLSTICTLTNWKVQARTRAEFRMSQASRVDARAQLHHVPL